MKDWKLKQEIYHRLHQNHSDDLNQVDIVHTHYIKEDALKHFFERIDEWVYPSKSYFVAFCYAHWLSLEYNEDFFELLRDPDLLYGNDPYFKTYEEDPETYDFLFDNVDWPIPMTGMVPDVREYFDAEFGYK